MTTIGLALGSGSARGLAHFGVLRAIREFGWEPRVVSGTSIGAAIGAAIAAGREEQLEESYRRMNRKQVISLLDLAIPRSSLIEGDKVIQFVARHIAVDDIEQLSMPFSAVATDLETGETAIFDKGPLAQAIKASSAVPGFLPPVSVNGRLYADGGLVDPVPVEPARALGADFIVAVDLNASLRSPEDKETRSQNREKTSDEASKNDWLGRLQRSIAQLDYPAVQSLRQWIQSEPSPGMWEVLMRSLDIMQARLTDFRLQLTRPDVLIRPELGDIRFLDFHRANEIIEIGYKTTVAELKAFEQRRGTREPLPLSDADRGK
jgi:NTE family protein